MSNWCLGCGCEIRGGDWCVLCRAGIALDRDRGLVPVDVDCPEGLRLPPPPLPLPLPTKSAEEDNEDIPF